MCVCSCGIILRIWKGLKKLELRQLNTSCTLRRLWNAFYACKAQNVTVIVWAIMITWCKYGSLVWRMWALSLLVLIRVSITSLCVSTASGERFSTERFIKKDYSPRHSIVWGSTTVLISLPSYIVCVQLTSWCIVFLHYSARQESPCLSWKPRFIIVLTKVRHRTLLWLNFLKLGMEIMPPPIGTLTSLLLTCQHEVRAKLWDGKPSDLLN
jgi:hypothetical protein